MDMEANTSFLTFLVVNAMKKIAPFFEIEPRLGQTVARHSAD